MNPTTVKTPAAGGQATTQGAPAMAAVVPFVRASLEHVEPFLDVSTSANQASAVAVNGGPVDVPAYGYLRGIVLHVAATGGTGTAAVYKEDAPWSVIQDVSILDVNGAPIVYLSGYSLYLINKWLGYSYSSNPTSAPAYVTPATSGNFTFILRIPVEIGRRDALGSLPNLNASSTYKLRITQAPKTAVYSTDPTGFPTIRWRAFLEAWAQPPASGPGGSVNSVQPAALGTTMFHTETTIAVSGSGQQRLRLPRVGNLLRGLVFIMRDGSSTRSGGASNFPTDLTLEWDSHTMVNLSATLLQHYAWERTGYSADTAVYVVDFAHDFDGKTGDEMRDLWLQTTQSTRLELSGTFGGSGSLSVVTCDVAPVGNVFV